MKKVLMSLAVMAIVFAGAAAAAAAEDQIVARVPFAFVVSGVQLPPGDYVVSRDTRHPELVTIALASGEGKTLTLSRASASRAAAADAPKLQFERIGGRMHLSQITLGPGDSREIDTPNSRH